MKLEIKVLSMQLAFLIIFSLLILFFMWDFYYYVLNNKVQTTNIETNETTIISKDSIDMNHKRELNGK